MTKYSRLFCLLSCACLLQARHQQQSCGTHSLRSGEEWQLHQQSRRSGVERGKAFAAASAPRPDLGNIALLGDSDGVVARRNAFSLDKQTLRFLPATNAKYRYEVGLDTYDSSLLSNSALIADLGDDDSREFSLPFAFSFFGVAYRSLFVNSDGNLTFGSGDQAITDRSLGRLTAGQPRIAPLFSDLDPTEAVTGVHVLSDGNRFVVTWSSVPTYTETGTGAPQTFQVRLFPDGRIEFAYSGIAVDDAVVGITPGRFQGAATLVGFAKDPSTEYSSTIAERFSGSERLDIFTASQKFYQSHDDAYDYLVFFNTLNIRADEDVVAFEVTVRNSRKGFGDPLVDIGSESGSKRRLQALLNLGPLTQYPRDPAGRVTARFSSGDTPVTVIAHEAGHLFLAYASIKDEAGGRPLLGTQAAHWAFNFNSEASVMEGNRIQDNGAAASPRFLTTATVEQYSPLDQYLMGFRPPQDVPDMFYVANSRGVSLPSPPRLGVSFNGERRDFRIDDIVREEGRRTPDSTVSQRRFRFAFILVTAEGQQPTVEQLAQVDGYRTAFESFYAKAVSENAVADTSLLRALHVTTFPAAGVAAGAVARGTISVEAAAVAPLTILLHSQRGLVQLPRSITIPTGSTQASFEFTGLRQGVDEVTATAADPGFSPVTSRIQVAPPEALRLVLVSGDLQTSRPGSPLAEAVRVRVTDINEIPYPGVTVAASITGGGTIQTGPLTSDADGVVSLRWTPSADLLNELRIALPSGASITATAQGRPSFASGAVVNAASFTPGLAAGGIATIFGVNLGGATLLLNGSPARVFYTGTRQVNFFVPLNTVPGIAELSIRTAAGTSDTVSVTVGREQPAIFFDAASGYGAVTVTGTGIVTQLRPAIRGETMEVYTTGLGQVMADESGLDRTTGRLQASIGGVPAEVTFSGLAPGFTGLYQANLRVPTGVQTGTQVLALSLNGLSSNAVKVEVR